MPLLAAIALLVPPPLFTEPLSSQRISAGRVCTADLNADGKPDLILRAREEAKPDRYRVFLNATAPGAALAFDEVESTNLPTPRDGDGLVFADFDNDGHADALFTRYLDINNAKFVEPDADPRRTAILPGKGDGTFAAPQILELAPRATTAAIAVADLNADGRLDIFLGNWYWNYGDDLRAFPSVALIQSGLGVKEPWWLDVPGSGRGHPQDDDPATAEPKYDPADDDRHRPLYGAVIAQLGDFAKSPSPRGEPIDESQLGRPRGDTGILCLAYGRRANVLWAPYNDPRRAQRQRWVDVAPALGLDGDTVRHGEYPDWLKERAKTDPRFDRQTEKPFRAHGNTFDAAVGDIDNDGDWDLFIAEITHAWAGESSDRSRFLVNQLAETGVLKFESPKRLSVDRIPPESAPQDQLRRWNQGDLFCELADMDNDGRLDLILSSGDYPDPPPFDERLRVYRQRTDGTFEDVSQEWGIDHVGSAQISLADVDLDGDVDILVGQSFTRFTPEMIEAAKARQNSPGPVARLYLNQTIERRKAAGLAPNGYTFLITGDPAKHVSRDALGTVVRLGATVAGKPITQQRQLIGIGGCAGEQHAFQVHIALPEGATKADSVEIISPNGRGTATLHDVPPGVHRINAIKP